MFVRIWFAKRGAHFHCRVFTKLLPGATFEKSGDLVFREKEWDQFCALMSHGNIEFRDEDEGKENS